MSFFFKKKDINTVLNALQELKDSENLPKLLEVI